MDRWHLEKEAARNGHRHVAGIDEAGRGPLAGPVVAAAVILAPAIPERYIVDSKRLSRAQRERQYETIYHHALSVGIGIVDAAEIDRINILQASLRAMAMAVDNLRPAADYLLIDGICRVPANLPQQPIPKGETHSISIAAASIVAKVTRDRMMDVYDQYYPQFGFARHKGYPTRDHKLAIGAFGCSPIHRRSFSGVREHLPVRRGMAPC
jgi:ribonuclease HII